MATRPSVFRGVQLAGAAVAGLIGYEYFEPILATTTKIINKVVPALTPAKYDCVETKFVWSAITVPHAPMGLCVQRAVPTPEAIPEIANSVIEPDNLLTSAPSLHPVVLMAFLFLFNLFTSMMKPPHRPTFSSIVQAIFAMLTALPTYLSSPGGLATFFLWLTPTVTIIIVPIYEIIKYLQTNRDQTNEALEQLRATTQHLQASFNSLKEQSEQQKLKINELQYSYEEIMGEYYELEGVLYAQEAEHDALKEECNRISASNERKRGRIFSLENQVEKLGLDCESLQEENQQLIEQIDELMGELPGELPGQEGEEEEEKEKEEEEEEEEEEDDDDDNDDPSQTGEDQVQNQEIGQDEIDNSADDSNQHKAPEHGHHQHHHLHLHHLDDPCDSPAEAAVAEQGGP